MLVGIWFGLYWVLFSFLDHYIQSSRGLPCFIKRSPLLYQGGLLGDRFISEDPLHGGVPGS